MNKKPATVLDSIVSVNIPSHIFLDRRFSALEAIVKYLRENFSMTYAQIAKLMNRDDRTIWTVYNRVRKKDE